MLSRSTRKVQPNPDKQTAIKLATPQKNMVRPISIKGALALIAGCSAALLLSACFAALGLTGRPQDPTDRPYKIETVQFAGGPGVTLAGELTMPESKGPHKALVLISGSGPQDRDEALADHRHFLVLSDHLTRAGYAVLRFDDRGFGESTGNFETATLTDFANDTAGAFRFLASQPEIDPAGIGFFGHSEGGYIAPAAARLVDPAFMIFAAGPARSFSDVLATQTADTLRAEGQSDEVIKKAVSDYLEGNKIIAQQKPIKEIHRELSAFMLSIGLPKNELEDILKSFAGPWGLEYATHKPEINLRAFDGPVLALFGDKDLQVSAKEEAPVMRKLLSNARSQVHVFAGLNHLFQPTETGLPSEYEEIEITFAEEVLDHITKWLDTL
ncbi:alpha/beta fold hydrolase [uncultured Maritalea sp.]|uniref:alpha/beta hydrolase family protein n=1 Tax=uncultured Maritalea sp. TaxID=757249 RepID=UPI002605A1CE|nr:alpha/beta fold hydrolase [uncultured Maritalea sp.]